MLRSAVALLALSFLAGCASGPQASEDPAAPVEPTTDRLVLEGTFSKAHVQGTEVTREGGLHAIDVTGWRNVLVELDIHIDADLFLLPPGCSGAQAPCALKFTPEAERDEQRWLVPAMEAGTWTALLDLQEGKQTYAGSVYTITLEYQDASASAGAKP